MVLTWSPSGKAVRWRLGMWSSEGLTGLDVQGGSLHGCRWCWLSAWSSVAVLNQNTYKWLLSVPGASHSCWVGLRGSSPQARVPREPGRCFQGFLCLNFRRPNRSVLLMKANLLCVRKRGTNWAYKDKMIQPVPLGSEELIRTIDM